MSYKKETTTLVHSTFKKIVEKPTNFKTSVCVYVWNDCMYDVCLFLCFLVFCLFACISVFVCISFFVLFFCPYISHRIMPTLLILAPSDFQTFSPSVSRDPSVPEAPGFQVSRDLSV